MEQSVKAEILVVDDHNLILEGICKMVNRMSEATVADAVTSGQKALELIEAHDYDVYILDISIPDVSGFELIEKIRELHAEARIIVSTMHEEVWMVNRLAQCGVNAVILKASASTELLQAIRNVLHGGTYTCPRFASISQKLTRGSAGMQSKDTPTRREQEVLEAVAKGMNTHEIALLLKISENTVETFRKRLISKFNAKNAIDMVVKAAAQGWVKLD